MSSEQRPHSNGAGQTPSTNDPNIFPSLNLGVAPADFSIPRGGSSTSWDYVDATQHVVRGPKYLSDKKKYPSAPAAFKLVEVAGFSTSGPCRFSQDLKDSYYNRARKAGRDVFIFVMHFDLRPMHTVMVFELDKDALGNDKPFATTFQRFLEGDDAYKNKRIKLLTSVVDANWMVKKAIGQPVPALIGNKLTCYYKQAADLCECTCDVNSSMAASAIVGVRAALIPCPPPLSECSPQKTPCFLSRPRFFPLFFAAGLAHGRAAARGFEAQTRPRATFVDCRPNSGDVVGSIFFRPGRAAARHPKFQIPPGESPFRAVSGGNMCNSFVVDPRPQSAEQH